MAKAKKAAASDGTKPIADIAHPGTSAPADTSKPIITHRSMVKDPMVVEEDAKPEDAALPPKKTSEIKITPPVTSAAADEQPPAETEQPPAAEEKPVEKTGTETQEPAETEELKANDTEDKKTPKSSQPDQDAKVQKLIDSKKYFLPINAVEQRRSKRVVMLGIVLVVLLAIAWVDIALDAGLIHLDNVKPLTHFFSN